MSRQVNVGQIVPNIQVGDTITLPPNASATVTNIGTELNPILQFSIPKGDAGAIKMIIVNELPQTGANDTIYLVPAEDTETGNNYDEYVYVNNAWEKLGGIQVQVNLKDYVKNTDYATASKGGVFKTSNSFATEVYNGYLLAQGKTYTQYESLNNNALISKQTLENVITGKALETSNNKVISISSSSTDTQYPSAKCVYDIIGDVETILTTLTTGSGV